MVGIVSYGGHIPRYRLDRGRIYKAMGWMNPANIANAKGEKAVANYDEDSITMAVAAGINALKTQERETIEGLYFASTTLPFKERLNSGIITAALGLNEHIRAVDFTGGLKAGTSAVLSALEAVAAGSAKKILVCAADSRLGQPASPQELIFGDAAAALVLGQDDVVAEFKGSYSVTYDFNDHYRGQFAKYDRQWEDRWIRDLGYNQFIPEAVRGLLDKYNLSIGDFAHVIYPCHYAAARKKINSILGISQQVEQTNLQEEVGESGTPHSLLMLARSLEKASPGDKVLVISFGHGCDALYFQVTENIEKLGNRDGITNELDRKTSLDNYTKYLVWRDMLPGDLGLRAEEDLWTRWSLLWRKRKDVLGLWGSRCKRCNTPQFPSQQVCVNQDCGAIDEMEPYRFADKIGHIASYTGDSLAVSYDPPAIYGQIIFDGGGKFMFDFTDCYLDELSVGMPVEMRFRRKYYDKKRDISGYFWKAAPVKEVE